MLFCFCSLLCLGIEFLISQNFVQQIKLELFSRYNGQAATFSLLRTMLQLLLQKLVSLVSFLCPNLALMNWGIVYSLF